MQALEVGEQEQQPILTSEPLDAQNQIPDMENLFEEATVKAVIKVSSYDSITVSSAWELTSVSMRYSKGEQVNTSLSRITYCTPVQVSFIYDGISKTE